jgi:hypothetical protein
MGLSQQSPVSCDFSETRSGRKDFSSSEDDAVNSNLPPPSAEESAWLRRMEALEDEEPFPGVGCRPPHKAPLREASDELARLEAAAPRAPTTRSSRARGG